MRAVRTTAAILLALASHAMLAGCVTEERGRQRSGERTPATLPEGYVLDGPVASPALTARRINTSVRAVIEPLGVVPFDGLVLPIVSPDGERLVTQTGTPPAWPTTLAQPGSGPSLRTRLEVYDIGESPPRRVRLDAPLEPGLLLGRSADERGFLVEEPRPDGSRRIGLADWRTGAIDWLADERGVVFIGGVLTASGDLLATRWPVDGADSAALWSKSLGVLSDVDGAAPVYPVVSGTPGEAGAFSITQSHGVTLTWWTYASGEPIVRARRRVPGASAMIDAYQATDPFRAIAPPAGEPRPGVLFFNPGAGRVSLFEPTRADFVPLADKSISAAWAQDEGGWAVLLTTPEGLKHQRLVSRGGVWEALPPANVLADVYVARATRAADRPFVLIGPAGEGATRRLSILGLDLLYDADESR